MTYTDKAPNRKPTGLLRGQAAKIARTHRVTLQHVLGVARGDWGGRPALVRTIESYRQKNTARQTSAA
jgi:hypothetical protein